MATILTSTLSPVAPASAAGTQTRLGFLARAWNAVVEARHRAAEREIERFIMARGGNLTDSVERELSRTFGTPAGRKD